MLYETVAELPEEAPREAETHTPAEKPAAPDLVTALEEGPVLLLARNRTVIELPCAWQWVGGGIDYDYRVPAWPVWWPDHARVHRLTHPLYRELAVRDFLYTSGLLPRPTCW